MPDHCIESSSGSSKVSENELFLYVATTIRVRVPSRQNILRSFSTFLTFFAKLTFSIWRYLVSVSRRIFMKFTPNRKFHTGTDKFFIFFWEFNWRFSHYKHFFPVFARIDVFPTKSVFCTEFKELETNVYFSNCLKIFWGKPQVLSVHYFSKFCSP